MSSGGWLAQKTLAIPGRRVTKTDLAIVTQPWLTQAVVWARIGSG